MLFTRQPTVETIITPKEGYHLQLKNNRADGQGYQADAIELVVYGNVPFYRSLEGARPFLLPAAQFELEQVREGRQTLKYAQYERKTSREAPPREIKKSANVNRERQSPREEKRVEKTESQTAEDENWDRRKQGRKKTGASDASAAPVKPQSKIAQMTPEVAPVIDFEAFRYDLVPPPETFVADSMESLKKSDDRTANEANEKSKTKDDPLDAVEAILRASDSETSSKNESTD